MWPVSGSRQEARRVRKTEEASGRIGAGGSGGRGVSQAGDSVLRVPYGPGCAWPVGSQGVDGSDRHAGAARGRNRGSGSKALGMISPVCGRAGASVQAASGWTPKCTWRTTGLALRRRAWDISSPRNSGQLTVMQADARPGSEPWSICTCETSRPAALKSRQICLRREPSSSRGQMTVSRDVPRRRPGRWRGPRRRGAGTSRRNAWRPPLQERRSGFANMRARAALGGRARWTCANAGAADERRFWRFTLGRCPASRGLARWRADAWTLGYAATCSTGAADGVLRDPVKQRCRCKIDFRRNRYSRRLLLGWITGRILRGFPLMDNTLVA